MKTEFCAACLQLNSNETPSMNLKKIQGLIYQACDQGANFIFLPEHSPYLLSGSFSAIKGIVLNWHSRALDFFINLAREKKVWICTTMGSLDKKTGNLVNRTYLISSDGKIVVTYDKIHLFNARLGGKENHSESKIYKPGSQIVTALTPWGKIGLAICYDLRFPYLFQQLRKDGADFFCIPSSFSYLTGQAHWHALLRARAIENSCYIFAPNQYGTQRSGLIAYGHSLIVSPWGEILRDGGEGVGLILAKVSRKEIKRVRLLIPSGNQV